ncbi:hypothetical protein, partial [Nocardia seriolae]
VAKASSAISLIPSIIDSKHSTRQLNSRNTPKNLLANNPIGAIANYAQATVLAIRFGPDAMDFTSPRGQTRMYYNDIRAVYTDNLHAVVLRHRGSLCAFPRELLPDWSIELITPARNGSQPPDRPTVAELPPIPVIDAPTASFISGPDTARAMARTYAPHALRPLLTCTPILPILPLEAALLMHSRTGNAMALALSAVCLGFLALASILTLRQSARSYARAVPVGRPLTVHYGTDAVDFQQATARSRTPYSAIRSIDIRGPIAALTTARTSVCPRELLPDNAIAHMCAVNPRIKVKR